MSNTVEVGPSNYDGDADSRLDDHQLALFIAKGAATTLLEIRRSLGIADQRTLKEAGDAGAQAYIAGQLAEHRPDDAILSEEAKDSELRLSAERVWIIDPLDGTREFSEGRDDWAVHVALWENGALEVGAVALGGAEHVLSTPDIAAPAPALGADTIRIAVSRTRPPELVEQVAAMTNTEFVPMGSAGVKVCAVVEGTVDAYIHAGGQFEWDSAAPVAVARAAGLHTSRVDGSPLIYNQRDPYLPDLVVCRPELVDRIFTLIADAGRDQTEVSS